MRQIERETTAETIARVLARGEADRAGYPADFVVEHYENPRSHPEPGHGVKFTYTDGRVEDFKPHRLVG